MTIFSSLDKVLDQRTDTQYCVLHSFSFKCSLRPHIHMIVACSMLTNSTFLSRSTISCVYLNRYVPLPCWVATRSRDVLLCVARLSSTKCALLKKFERRHFKNSKVSWTTCLRQVYIVLVSRATLLVHSDYRCCCFLLKTARHERVHRGTLQLNVKGSRANSSGRHSYKRRSR